MATHCVIREERTKSLCIIYRYFFYNNLILVPSFTSKLIAIFDSTIKFRGTAVAQRLRCCATNRKVVGSIPDGVIGIFH